MYTSGEFLQYTDPTSDSNEAVVNWNAPYSTVTVNRGIAVRRLHEIVTVLWPSGNIEVDCVATPLVGGKHTTASGLTITKTGVTTVVESPKTGLIVTVETNGWGQNLWVRIIGALAG